MQWHQWSAVDLNTETTDNFDEEKVTLRSIIVFTDTERQTMENIKLKNTK